MGGTLDNGLSPKGHAQAEDFARRFVAGEIVEKPECAVLVSSPKLRCRETLGPLAKALKVEIKINSLLDEGDVEWKIEEFFGNWLSGPESLTVINTHGDWIPEFFEMKLGARIDLKKGGFAVVRCEGRRLSATVFSRD